MPTQVTMPQLGESVLEGTISKWLVVEGEQINEYDPILEVNTDKIDTEIPSPASGILIKVLVPEGTVVQVGTNLAWIGEPGEEIPDDDMAIITDKSDHAGIKSQTEVPPTQMAPQLTQSPGRDRDLGFISPVVAKIASEQNINLSLVPGSGRGGRITKSDVLAYIDSMDGGTSPEEILDTGGMATPPKFAPTERTAPDASGSRQVTSSIQPGEVVSLTPVRRAIAEHMVHSKHTSPHVTTVMEANLSKVIIHRDANKEIFARDGVKLTFTAYFVSASVTALKTYPIVNSSWRDEGIQIHRDINIGMATSMGETGLIVPVIKNTDTLSLLGIAQSVDDLAKRTRAKQLKLDDVQGGTFTITNHGISGSLFATPIINQPQCGILGVGAIQKRVVVIDDMIAIRPMVYLSLTFDHRILDGAIADYYLAKVVESLENWH